MQFKNSPSFVVGQLKNGEYELIGVYGQPREAREKLREESAKGEWLAIFAHTTRAENKFVDRKWLAALEAPKPEKSDEAPKKRGRKPKSQD